jgi:hypothetical protein
MPKKTFAIITTIVVIIALWAYFQWFRFEPRPAIIDSETEKIISTPENAFREVPGEAEDYFY